MDLTTSIGTINSHSDCSMIHLMPSIILIILTSVVTLMMSPCSASSRANRMKPPTPFSPKERMAAALPMGSSDKSVSIVRITILAGTGAVSKVVEFRMPFCPSLPIASARYKKKARAKQASHHTAAAELTSSLHIKLAINGEPWQRRSCRGVSPCRGHRGRRSPAAGVGVAAVLQKGVRDA